MYFFFIKRNSKILDANSKTFDEISEETPEQLEEKKKKKESKEAKENQTEEFYRNKYLFKERELLKEINQWAAVLNEVPIGRDRAFRRYYRLVGVDQLLVENDDNGAELLLDSQRHQKEDADFESEDEMVNRLSIIFFKFNLQSFLL